MEESTRKQLRREGNTQAGVLLIYMGIMNVAVAVVIVLAAIFQLLQSVLSQGDADQWLNSIDSALELAVISADLGYLLAIVVGMLMLLLWKKPAYIRDTILQSEKRMSWRDFMLLSVLFFTGQQLFQWWYLLLDWLGRLMGISVDSILDSVSVDTHRLPMFLYAGILGPIAEEILFRGLVLRSLRPYGKKFAIVVSAILFGLFHGNLMQVPFAFVVGLVLGYVALEYSIGWAVVLHVMNNLGYADLLPRLLSHLPAGVDEVIITVFLWICTVGSVVILICHWPQICQYWRANPTEKGSYAAFFRAPAMTVFLVLMVPVILLALPLLGLLS